MTLLTCSIAISLLSLALPVTTLQVYDRILPNHSSGTLTILVLGVAVAMALEFLLRLARADLIGVTGAAYVHGLSSAAVRHTLVADLGRQRESSERIDFHSVSGQLEFTSATTFGGEDGERYYRGRVMLDQSYVGPRAGQNQITPGMTVMAEIITGKKTILEYLLKPVHVAVTLAFSER